MGYVVAPTLFSTVPDKVLAGTIAGSLFQIEAWLSVSCAVVLLVLVYLQSRGTTSSLVPRAVPVLVSCMLACTLLGYFALHPFMEALRENAGPGGVMSSELRMQFGILHGLSSAIYLIESLLGAALILKIR